MKFYIKHRIEGRIRVHLARNALSFQEADTLEYYLKTSPNVKKVKVYEQTADAAIEFSGDGADVIEALRTASLDSISVPEHVMEHSGRALSAEFREKLTTKVLIHFATKLLPYPLRIAIRIYKALGYVRAGLRCLRDRRLEVPVLDATAITVSLLRGDFETAGSVMFLLEIGETLEDWTHKKSVGDLARSMSLNIEKVWIQAGTQRVLVNSAQVQAGDLAVVGAGSMIPFDGTVTAGEATVNQASLTGESLPVAKHIGGEVYAGTVVEEGELTFRVKSVSGATKYEKIVRMIEDTEKLKSAVESRAEHLADRLVPYTLAGTVLVWLLTRNVTKTLSVLMVDFSCALKLAMPVTVLSAIREASAGQITAKGGKFLEAMAVADTIVFDKTGTLTKATPTVRKIIPFCDSSEEELLRIAACLEEHFPHSMANAVVKAASDRSIQHSEMHSKVDYIVAHGIASYVEDKRVVIGSHHFVFEDEGCTIQSQYHDRFESLPLQYSHLYMAIDGVLAAVICIEDPIRPEAPDVIRALRAAGFRKIVMMTGDSERTAAAIAAKIGVDEYHAEVLPEDKASFVRREQARGGVVVMVGDGINDSPALSAANVGIAISDGAQIAREIADIMIAADDLRELVNLRTLSRAMMQRINRNYRLILGINGALIALGVAGVIQPTTSALLHNTSTLLITLQSMSNLIERGAPTADTPCNA